MRIEFDPTRPQTADDRQALLLISEGFRRLRAAKVSNAGTGAPGVAVSTPATHASDPTNESVESKHGR
jgi:hypothetical protein